MVVKCADFQPEKFFKSIGTLKNRKGNPGKDKEKIRHYMAITTAFDIETSYIKEIDESIMYIWQWALGEDLVVYGRTWDEYRQTVKAVKAALPPDRWLVCFVHNLSFEFQWLKSIFSFLDRDVFALASRKVLKCDAAEFLEFRCSYRLANMSLDMFTKKYNVKHGKLSGDEFDYSKVRYPWTELTERELEYCTNDVQGLVEAINAQLARDGDTLQTMPLTSTGYVRREAKLAMRNSGQHHSSIWYMQPDIDLYRALRAAFRGGDTHASRFYATTEEYAQTVNYVHSADRSSSYPAVMVNNLYPMKPFVKIAACDLNEDYIKRGITIRHWALLLKVKLTNVSLRDPYYPAPYISKDKCEKLQMEILEETRKGKRKKVFYHEDNGRVIKAAALVMTVTDIDLRIILNTYDCKMEVLEGWFSYYEPLPEPLRKLVIKYYIGKTELKGVPGKEQYYNKFKELINALYGMMAQNPVKKSVIFQQVDEWPEADTPDEELLIKHNKTAFLCYQWGVWVTAWARYMLYLGVQNVIKQGGEFIYCDTDSVKYTGNVDWTEYNKARIEECLASGAYATDPKGVTHYMGVFESEDNKETGYAYYAFRTMGAKKYAYVEKEIESWKETIKIGDKEYTYTKIGKGRTHCTIAGVNKKKGGAELDAHGGLEAFQEGFTFYDAGGTESRYSDIPTVKEYTTEGHTVEVISNISILPSMYTLGVTGEYERIIKYAKSYLDNPNVV